MTIHRIDHAVVIDTDDVPGRGGYAVVGISPHVAPAERAFLAGNFGISDYLHDPRTENRIFYSLFRIPGGRRAFVRRFARAGELRRNNTQRRLVIHTLLLGDEVWNDLWALPWLLVNAKLQLEGSGAPFRLSTDVPWRDENEPLPALIWDSDDGVTAGIAAKLNSRIALVGEAGWAHDLLASVLTTLASRSRVTLPQDASFEWVTMLAWSMLPRHDRDELAWTQHDAMNISGVAFPIANAPGASYDPVSPPATFATELVRMHTVSEESWVDVERRTARHPLTVRNAQDLDRWMHWRDAFHQLREHIHAAEKHVVEQMTRLAKVVEGNPGAPWIDDEEALQLIWSNVSDAMQSGETAAETAITTWGRRLRASGLDQVIFRAAPSGRWLARAAGEVGASALLWFFLTGGGEDEAAAPTRAALAEWLVAHPVEVDEKHVARLAFLLANDGSPSLHALLEMLLATSRGFDALLAYLRERQGGVHLVHAAAPIALARNHRNTAAFFREIFIPRCDPNRVDAQLARGIAEVLRDDSAAFRKLLAKLTRDARAALIALVRTWVESEPKSALPLARDVLADLQKQEGGIELAGPLAITLAQAGEPAKTWFDALLRMARAAELRLDEESTRVFLSLVKRIGEVPLDLSGSIEKLLPLLENQELRSPDATRALLLLTRPAWASGGTPFVKVLRQQIERSYAAGVWEEIVLAYAHDLRRKQPGDVSDVVAAFWARLGSSELERIEAPTIALLDLVNATGVQRLERGWRTRLRSLPVCAASKRLVALLRQEHSFEQEAELAIRDIENGVAIPLTLTRLEAALRRINATTAESQFVRHAESYLGLGGPAPRLVRLVQLFAADDLLPKPRLALRVHLLPKLLQSMTRRKYWKELRTAVNEAELLSIGVPVRLAYAAGMHADRKTLQVFEGTWRAHGRNDALDALAAGRDARRLKRRLARAVGFRQASALAQ